MKTKNITVPVVIYGYDELPEHCRHLIDKAKESTTRAYAPYSDFRVGAAVLLENGTVMCGSNQENAAYPSGLCAERVAMFHANSEYPDVAPKAIAIAAYNNGQFTVEPITPCGACRQVLLESELRYDTRIEVLLYGTDAVYHLRSIKDLLPLAFDKL